MPNYDFKCEECGLIRTECMSFKDSEAGLACECRGNMVRQFTPCKNIHGFKPPYKPGHDAREDRKRAFIAQERQGKLPKDIDEHNASFADLM